MPVGILACGPSGVGKSTHIEEMLKYAKISKNAKLIDPDKLPLTSGTDDRSDRAYELLHETIDEGKTFVYSASCLRKHKLAEVFNHMKEKKYKIVVAMIYASLPVAMERLKKRLDQPIRAKTALHFHNDFKERAPELMEDPMIDEIYLYNNENKFSLLLSKKNKKIVCRSDDADFFFDISEYCGRS